MEYIDEIRVSLKITSPFFEIEVPSVSIEQSRGHVRRAVCWHNSFMRELNPRPHPLRCFDASDYVHKMRAYRRAKKYHPFKVTATPLPNSSRFFVTLQS
jgi:hypothetical protein